MYTAGHSRLISTGVYIPEQRITSQEIMEQIDAGNRFGVSLEWLERVTGIKEKRVTPVGMLPSDMAIHAAKEALERAEISPKEIDAIIYAGTVRDFIEPATAHIVQTKLAADRAMVFNVTNACHGFMNGIHLMDALIASGQARRGLVVTGEQGSLVAQAAINNLKNSQEKHELLKLTAGLTLGDAGAAVLMGPKLGPETGFMGFMLESHGQFAHFCKAGAPFTGLQEAPLVTDMAAIIGQGLELITNMYHEFMNKHLKWKTEELAVYVIHQVGASIFKQHSPRMGVPVDIMPKTVVDMGNLITATIPLNLHKVIINEEVKMGQKVYLSGAGSGISISQAGLIWDAA